MANNPREDTPIFIAIALSYPLHWANKRNLSKYMVGFPVVG
ncbi:hypothetical protein DB29_03861 [Shouchella clausii]|nr:hypothetical protein DB29_03861 [Shouchella clausii]